MSVDPDPRRRGMSLHRRTTCPRPARVAGAATVEFSIVALTALIPFVLGILQLGLLFVTQHTVQHATFLAARAGAVDHGSRDEMRRYFAKGIVPLHARSTDDLTPASAGRTLGGAYGSALADALRPDRTRLTVVNPTRAAFDDFERVQNGTVQIPNRYSRIQVGATSGMTLADANLLRIRIEYCAELVVPFIDRMLTSTLRRFDADPFRQQCYAVRRMPIVGHATVHMHTAARRAAVAPA